MKGLIMRHRGGSGARARLLVRGGVAVTGVLVMASCGAQGATSSSNAPSLASPTWAAPPVSSPPAVATKAAVAAYVGMWRAMARAGETSDWQSLELGYYATGEALATITRSLYTDHLDKVVTRGAPTNSPVVRDAEPVNAPTKVLIEDCGDSTSWLKYYQGTDRPAGSGSGGGRRFVTAEVLRQSDGSWLVSRFAVQGLSTC
jgi:hypothetical protein